MSDLISREALLEKIKRYQMDIVSKATAMKVIRNAPSVTDTNVGEWILCSERMPENDGYVLICSGEFVREAYFENGNFSNTYGMWYKAVTHWMPLPEAYKGE